MRSLLSTPALREKITGMNERREKDGWTAADEQILAFLLELLELRLFFHSARMNADEEQSKIYRLHDKMQDEKNLLITEY